jgi:undecaprenyl-diphosphatase
MVDAFQALILGILEGVTEFLPISSTGHLILGARLLGIPQDDFAKSFEIIIQLGAIFSVLTLYWRRLLINRQVLSRVMAAFLPTAVIGFLLYKTIKTHLIGNETVVLAALFVGGIALIALELLHKEKASAAASIEEIGYGTAVLVGCFQAVAMIPGVSRSGATIAGGLIAGIRREVIVEFSFLLAIPTMAAATGLDLVKNAGSFSSDQVTALAIGFCSAFVTALLAIKFLLAFIKRHTFIVFGVYRILLALFWVYLF